jgi:hypothetical protein
VSSSGGTPKEVKPDEVAVTTEEAQEVEEKLDEAASSGEVRSRDAAHWAKMVSTLKVTDAPEGAINKNVTGRKVMSPIQGFGKMWQKTYGVTLANAGVGPTEVITEWKEKFPKFWPEGNRFYGPLTGIAPGEVALLSLSMPGKLKLSTGVLVLYADEESFTLMTPQGHMFAGWITFSAEDRKGATYVQAQVLMRANDPLYELGLGMGGHKKEDKFWEHTLSSLAAHFGVEKPEIETQMVCVDSKRQWRMTKNIWHNSAIRSGMYATGAPFRWIAKPFRSSKKKADATPADKTDS